jgi:hypothetical protein
MPHNPGFPIGVQIYLTILIRYFGFWPDSPVLTCKTGLGTESGTPYKVLVKSPWDNPEALETEPGVNLNPLIHYGVARTIASTMTSTINREV